MSQVTGTWTGSRHYSTGTRGHYEYCTRVDESVPVLKEVGHGKWQVTSETEGSISKRQFFNNVNMAVASPLGSRAFRVFQ